MKVLWHSNAPWAGSGYGTQTDLFTRAMLGEGYKVNVSASFGLAGAPLVVNDNMRVLGSGMTQYGNWVLPQHIQQYQPDVAVGLFDIWVFDPQTLKGYPFCWWTPVDSDPIPPLVAQKLRFIRHPWAMSRFGEQKMREVGIEPRYVPHGIDTETFKPLEDRKQGRKILGVPDDAFLFVSVAANKGYPSRKNLPQLLKAFASIAKRHDDAYLYLHAMTVVTDTAIDIMGIAEFYQIPNEKIIFPRDYEINQGLITPQAMNLIYNAADSFVLPSAGEGFGIPAVEAQAAGCPVIVTDFTAQSELCGSGIKIGVDADDLITTLQGAEQALNLRPSKIAHAMEMAYQTWKNNELMRNGARQFALAYDYQKVWELHMKPALEDAYLENQKLRGTSEGKYALRGFDYHWHEPEGGHYQQWVEMQLSYLPEKGEGASVLDFGCGDGYPASKLDARGFAVFGVDPVEGALREAKKRVPNAQFRTSLDHHEETGFDYVLALDVIEHMNDPDELIRAVKCAKRFALISTPPPGLDQHAVRGYTLRDLVNLFTDDTVKVLHSSMFDQLVKVTPGKVAKVPPQKMKIAVLSDCRVPTIGDGGHGLGNSAYEIAKGLAKSHDVTLFAGVGSSFPEGELEVHESEEIRVNDFVQRGLQFDVVIDCSHAHMLSLYRPDWAIVNRLGDGECPYSPPNMVMPSEFLQKKYGGGKIIKTGIDVDAIPERNGEQPEPWVLYFGRLADKKGVKSAIEAMRLAGVKIKFAGPKQGIFNIPDEDYLGELRGDEKWETLQKAYAVIAPGGVDHAPRVPLEAAAAGVPTLGMIYDGTKEHIKNGVSGFATFDVISLGQSILAIPSLDPKTMREWVATEHSYDAMIKAYEDVCRDVIRGERW